MGFHRKLFSHLYIHKMLQNTPNVTYIPIRIQINSYKLKIFHLLKNNSLYYQLKLLINLCELRNKYYHNILIILNSNHSFN